MLFGKNLINGEWLGSNQRSASTELEGVSFAQATHEQVDQVCTAARNAFREYSHTKRSTRAAFLKRIADEIDALGDQITVTGMKETGLPEARLVGERGRTVNQLRMFADVIEDDDFLDVRKVEAAPDREPVARPDLRLTHRALGPVVVFGASNFPLAFSTAGGDTASALAAGCPVIVKGHSAHAGTAELVAQAIAKAISDCGMPAGTFQMLQGSGRVVGVALVQHPDVRAVGFTGSTAGGRALYDLCHARAQPIPFYGELGSVNPVFCLPHAVNARAATIGSSWAASLMMGAGQFCTNPGVMIGVKGEAFSALQSAAVETLNAGPEQKMLSAGIHSAYCDGVSGLAEKIEQITSSKPAEASQHARAAAFCTDALTWMSSPALQHEVFGAAGVFIECSSVNQMLELADALEGQLTCTLQMDSEDLAMARLLLPVIEEKAGRLLCNGFPTGVEVCSAMMHGGPYPASTDVRSTSVGTLAINRWLRPVAYQDFPQSLLHDELVN